MEERAILTFVGLSVGYGYILPRNKVLDKCSPINYYTQVTVIHFLALVIKL